MRSVSVGPCKKRAQQRTCILLCSVVLVGACRWVKTRPPKDVNTTRTLAENQATQLSEPCEPCIALLWVPVHQKCWLKEKKKTA